MVEVQRVSRTFRRKVGSLAVKGVAQSTAGTGPLKSPISTKHMLVQVVCSARCMLFLLAGVPLQ